MSEGLDPPIELSNDLVIVGLLLQEGILLLLALQGLLEVLYHPVLLGLPLLARILEGLQLVG